MVAMSVKRYLELCEKYFREGEGLLAEGQLTQASEKFWGAVAESIKAVAESRGWSHARHRHLSVAIARLYEEVKDPEIPRLYASAESLHANFYEGFAPESMVKLYYEDAKRLIGKLKALVKL